MATIRLERNAWTYDEADRLGPRGGFGEVFRGHGDVGEVAIKRLLLTADAAAHRELKIGAVLADRSLEHVVPIIDYGQDADSNRYYLVMPVCDGSLQDHLSGGSSLSLAESKTIALDVLAGLMEVGDVVHRDLKPGNILSLNGSWRVGDFGIAKFVEDSTSLETLRDALTPLYGAPEQWMGERPSHATDVYALGCILHAMIKGQPPFTGSRDDVRNAHLHSAPPPLESGDSRLDGLVAHMLRKPPESRPALKRCASVISSVGTASARSIHSALAAAGHTVAQEEAAAEAKRREEEAKLAARVRLAADAMSELNAMFGRLFDQIEQSADSSRRSPRAITLGTAHLSYDEPVMGSRQAIEADPIRGKLPAWDVAAYSIVMLRVSALERYHTHQLDTYTWSATLAFARTPEDDSFRWRELAFWSLSEQRMDFPAALMPVGRDFQLAMSAGMHVWSLAYGPLTIDGEDEEGFQDRWLGLFAKAAQRKLRQPDHMPLQPHDLG